jgi:diaminopimelate decarboxylase
VANPGIDFRQIAEDHMSEGGLFVYESAKLTEAAESLLALEMPFGLTVRYAAKANPHPGIVRQFDEMGLHFDASSVYEADRLAKDVDADKISLSSQVLKQGEKLQSLLEMGIRPVATSIRQLEMLGRMGCSTLAIRVNPGMGGGGHNRRTSVGGPASSFGIWHEELDLAKGLAKEDSLTINRLHTHIGSGADPSIWRSTIQRSLGIVELLEDVETLDIGGGYKVGRMPGEQTTDMQEVGKVFAEELETFEDKTGRKIHLEIEPGTFLVALAGTLLGRVEEVVSTDFYNFLKLNVGMNAILRPSLYGAQHPIEVINDSKYLKDYAVVGPCCESGDILTPAPGDPEEIQPRQLKAADTGDIVAIGAVGAYCASMSANRYNDIPPATEIIL